VERGAVERGAVKRGAVKRGAVERRAARPRSRQTVPAAVLAPAHQPAYQSTPARHWPPRPRKRWPRLRKVVGGACCPWCCSVWSSRWRLGSPPRLGCAARPGSSPQRHDCARIGSRGSTAHFVRSPRYRDRHHGLWTNFGLHGPHGPTLSAGGATSAGLWVAPIAPRCPITAATAKQYYDALDTSGTSLPPDNDHGGGTSASQSECEAGSQMGVQGRCRVAPVGHYAYGLCLADWKSLRRRAAWHRRAALIRRG
jgi:hypothetical protein